MGGGFIVPRCSFSTGQAHTHTPAGADPRTAATQHILVYVGASCTQLKRDLAVKQKDSLPSLERIHHPTDFEQQKIAKDWEARGSSSYWLVRIPKPCFPLTGIK